MPIFLMILKVIENNWLFSCMLYSNLCNFAALIVNLNNLFNNE